MKLPQREGDNFKEFTLDHTKKKIKNISKGSTQIVNRVNADNSMATRKGQKQ